MFSPTAQTSENCEKTTVRVLVCEKKNNKPVMLRFRAVRIWTKQVRFYCGSNVNFENRAVQRYLHDLQTEFESLTKTDARNSRLLYLRPIMDHLAKIREQTENISNLDSLIENEDYEFRKLAEAEKTDYENYRKELETELMTDLQSYESQIGGGRLSAANGIVLEIKSGAGGQEAMIFAKEMFNMYRGFCEFRGFNFSEIDCDFAELDGMRHGSLMINDPDAYALLKHEAGVHRVQRIPKTDRAGRMHTSTVSVWILPQPNAIDIQIADRDLRWETKRATGAGGQHVNKTESAVRLIHLPTGLTTECQTSRSQIENRKTALQKIRTILFDREQNQLNETRSDLRKSQVLNSERNEKIRTYNFSQDRMTDHRVHFTVHNLKEIFDGDQFFNMFLEKLDRQIRLYSFKKVLEKYQ